MGTMCWTASRKTDYVGCTRADQCWTTVILCNKLIQTNPSLTYKGKGRNPRKKTWKPFLSYKVGQLASLTDCAMKTWTFSVRFSPFSSVWRWAEMGNVLTMKRTEKRGYWKFEKEIYCQTNTKKNANTNTKTKTNIKAKTKFVGSDKEMYYQRRSSYCSVSFPDNR